MNFHRQNPVIFIEIHAFGNLVKDFPMEIMQRVQVGHVDLQKMAGLHFANFASDGIIWQFYGILKQIVVWFMYHGIYMTIHSTSKNTIAVRFMLHFIVFYFCACLPV